MSRSRPPNIFSRVLIVALSDRDKLRVTRTAALDTQGEQTNHAEFLGFEGEAFKFDHVENPVNFVDVSAETGKDKIMPVEAWMRGITTL